MNNIVRLQTQLPSQPISPESIPAPIKEALQELYASFADAGRKEDIDKAYMMKGYIRAVVGQNPAIVLWAVQHLILHNPRNPFRPTAQDVFELIKKRRKELRAEVCGYFLGNLSWGGYKVSNPRPKKSHPLLIQELESLGDLTSEVVGILRSEIPEVDFALFGQSDVDDIPRDAWPPGEYERACGEVLRAEQQAVERIAIEEAENKRRIEKYGRTA